MLSMLQIRTNFLAVLKHLLKPNYGQNRSLTGCLGPFVTRRAAMKKLIQALAIAVVASAAALAVPLANADSPWGIQLFGMQFGQSRIESPWV